MRAASESPTHAGERAYHEWRDGFLAHPENKRLYEEESEKSELWLQLVEARQEAGLTQAQVAQRLGVSPMRVVRIERRGYDACSLNALRRYVAALGEEFRLEVRVRHEPRTAGV